MNTKDSNYMNQLYESPLVMVIEIDGNDVICVSTGTEGYGMNEHFLDDSDFE
ncbi:MAG: hypothetical protein MJZ16_12230 [Bacteroidales bacterium]|nr:hypothetical protein [Bacteroidales bacterium]